jgi:protein subunit release factor B
MNPRYPTDRPSLERVCEVEATRGSGPGGQHRNKVETGVRVTHALSGIVVLATRHRSRERNLDDAYERIAARLEALQKPVIPRRPTKPTAGAKRRRLADKRHQARKKSGRGGGQHDD